MASRYKAGAMFKKPTDLFKEQFVWVEPWKRATSASFFWSWQFRMACLWINEGKIRKAKLLTKEK
jgi:hypothetical protein